MTTPLSVLRFLADEAAAGQRTALIVLTGIEGSAARGVGTLMAVSDRDNAEAAWLGSLSGGCVETSLVGEAQRVIAAGRAEMLRIGAGSPLIDIRLPCGSGMDLLIVPFPDRDSAITEACKALAGRQPATLTFTRDGQVKVINEPAKTGWQDDLFTLHIVPQLRVLIAGHGEEVTALAALAHAWGAEVVVLSPEQRIVEASAAYGETVWLKSPGSNPSLALDRWSALVMLFHDHDWETALLAQAVGQPALFIGAMG